MTLYDDLQDACVHVEQVAEDQIISEFVFKRSMALFKGHFPEKPLLPGIVQLEMVRYSLETQLALTLAIGSIKKTKFTDQILPEDTIGLDIGFKEDQGAIAARATVKANGRMAGKVIITFLRV